MAGHSKFKNIQYRKGAQDKKKATLFAKLAREITVATREGGSSDPNANARLRLALNVARSQSMPKVNIDRAISKGLGSADADEQYENMRYDGYGPGKVAFIVECMTNNRNRTASSVRLKFSKAGGSLTESGSFNFLFSHVGYIEVPSTIDSFENFESICIMAEAEDTYQDHDLYVVITKDTNFHHVLEELHKSYNQDMDAKLIWKANQPTTVSDDTARKVLHFLDQLDEDEDVQNIYTAMDYTDDVYKVMESMDA